MKYYPLIFLSIFISSNCYSNPESTHRNTSFSKHRNKTPQHKFFKHRNKTQSSSKHRNKTQTKSNQKANKTKTTNVKGHFSYYPGEPRQLREPGSLGGACGKLSKTLSRKKT